jgi:hypothetical protein
MRDYLQKGTPQYKWCFLLKMSTKRRLTERYRLVKKTKNTQRNMPNHFK